MGNSMPSHPISAEKATKPMLLPLCCHGGMTKAVPMQGGYHTGQCKQVQQLTETSSDSMPHVTGLMNKNSGAPQSGMSIS